MWIHANKMSHFISKMPFAFALPVASWQAFCHIKDNHLEFTQANSTAMGNITQTVTVIQQQSVWMFLECVQTSWLLTNATAELSACHYNSTPANIVLTEGCVKPVTEKHESPSHPFSGLRHPITCARLICCRILFHQLKLLVNPSLSPTRRDTINWKKKNNCKTCLVMPQ